MSGTPISVPGQPTTTFDATAFMEHVNATMNTFNQRLNDQEALLQELNQLRLENEDLKLQIANLRKQLAQQEADSKSAPSVSTASVSDSANPAPTTGTPSFAAIAAKNVPAPPIGGHKRTSAARKGYATTKRQRLAAARAFKTPEKQGPQGFEMVYIARSRRLDRRETRSRLRRAGVDTSRVLDISFPASGVIAVLLHTQYASDFKAIMERAEADIFSSFDPLDPKHLADPKYDSLYVAGREQEIALLVHKRCRHTLSFVRPHIVGPLARHFEQLGWISSEDVHQALRQARLRLKKENARQAAFVFRGIETASEGDSSDTDDSGSEMSE